MQYLKQSTAFTFRIGPFVDSTDGVTAETALSIAQADIQISKNGGAFAQTSATSPTTTHDVDGWYQCPLTATDTGTLGTLDVQVTMSGALPVWRHFTVVPANVYDSLVAGSDTLQADLTQILGSAVSTTAAQLGVNVVNAGGTAWASGSLTSAVFASGAITAAAIAADAIGASELAADAVLEIADGVWDEARAGHVTAGSFGEGVASVQGNVTGSVASVTGAVGSVTGAVGSVTGNVGGNVVGSVASVTGAVGSVTGAVGSVTGNVGGNVVGSTASVTGAVGSVSGNVDGNVTGSVGSLGATAKNEVNAEVVDVLTVDTMTLPGQTAPTATPTFREAIGYLFKAWRNKKTQTSSEYKLFADDTTTVDQKAAVSDDGTTTTVGEVATGP